MNPTPPGRFRACPPIAPPLSRSVEDYLKAIWSLVERGEAASTSNIAQALDVQPASVSGMVKRLAEAGWVEHLRYRGVTLTDEGNREALRIVRRHRVLETYLSRRLGYSWDDVHAEAERLEHAASDDLIDRMAAALEHPPRTPTARRFPPGGARWRPAPAWCSPTRSLEARFGSGPCATTTRSASGSWSPGGSSPASWWRGGARVAPGGPLTVRVGGEGGKPQTMGVQLAGRIWVAPADEEG
jgi:Mn-dependent DtxR family transcriptional regulator